MNIVATSPERLRLKNIIEGAIFDALSDFKNNQTNIASEQARKNLAKHATWQVLERLTIDE